ncbi:glutamine synthetase family protein [Dubosiella newyorkensis]|uniref:Uncharacterized protein n=2 Tax=Dubosiella newyorkensis TaxID=1862672 RepID=A0A1U7NNC4_9FIRM|nr:glutamine synthetase family protein [Dubosiella newyorkensis]MCI9041070.1 glutamine synthetase [Dubosiella newyorkensis]OLU46833.1 hypothetical protein BO225_04485 [Dubosiella newyorkensis]
MDTIDELLSFLEEEDVRFIRLTFYDMYGVQKNISILPDLLPRALQEGIAIDTFAIPSLSARSGNTLYLKPDPKTMSVLPWRSNEGNVISLICSIYEADGSPCAYDGRRMLQETLKEAVQSDLFLNLSTQFEFYLFLQDEMGNDTHRPLDYASFMDVAPEDKGENIRRDICLTLSEMGLQPQASYHQAGFGQNEIDFHSSSPLQAADEAMIFKWVVKILANANGLFADFSPKPLENGPGNGMHIKFSFSKHENRKKIESFIAGILQHIRAMTLFLNPINASYARFGKEKAPDHITWSYEFPYELIHIDPKNKHIFELRSPDPQCNPYLCFSLLIKAGMDGIAQDLVLERPLGATCDLGTIQRLPKNKEEAYACAINDQWLLSIVPRELIELYR